jgi:hypothetical protein
MLGSILEQARQKRQTRTAIAWIGGGCFVLVLAVGQLVLLGWWANSRLTAKMAQMENMKRVRTQAEHPVLPPCCGQPAPRSAPRLLV